MDRLRAIQFRTWLTAAALPAALLLVFCRPAAAQNPGNFSDSGTFEIRSNGQVVGTEKFHISRAGASWESAAELTLKTGEGSSEEKATLHLNSSLRPQEYLRDQKSPNIASLAVRFGDKESSLVTTSGKDSSEQVFYLPQGFLVILDTNLFHHYTFLLRQYTRSQGGEQPFNVFIPQEALPGTVNLTYIGKSGDEERWKVSTDELEMEIVARESGAIQRITIPSASVEVVRK
jgi:hypothetical protein